MALCPSQTACTRRKTADEYFWGSEFLFLCYMDVSATYGGDWPHYSLAEQNLPNYRFNAFQPFKAYLEGLRKRVFSEDDILQALSSSTHKDHSGFFEFWNDMGFDIAPTDVPSLSSWDPSAWAPYTTRVIPSMSTVGQSQTTKAPVPQSQKPAAAIWTSFC